MLEYQVPLENLSAGIDMLEAHIGIEFIRLQFVKKLSVLLSFKTEKLLPAGAFPF
ncbi:hypothetical protein [Adhaeribacter arboris]|uniref:hypothetical protein n=1 Tax=Adhaeribacter arboris TaxID=2072846 RepID=UPI001304F379|nr:hypothetical protein [Adhaeribacter arboris]